MAVGCNKFSLFGFRGNLCGEWEWTFSHNDHLDWSSIICHVVICLVYHVSTLHLKSIFIKNSPPPPPPTTTTTSTTSSSAIAISAAAAVTTPPTSTNPDDNKKKKEFSILSELLTYSAASQTWLNGFKFYHNVSLALVSLWMFVMLLWSIVQDGRLNSWEDMACRVTPMTGIYGIVNFVYLITKLWEWIDSYILIVDRKSLLSLHWFHHMTTFTMAAVTHNFPVGGFALINCLVHTVMYAHYASPITWARPFITSGQLIQFVIVMSIHVYGFISPSCYDMKPVFWEWLYCQSVVFGYFLLFLKFFYDEYLAGKEKKKKIGNVNKSE